MTVIDDKLELLKVIAHPVRMASVMFIAPSFHFYRIRRRELDR
jgi:hypothetical protein